MKRYSIETLPVPDDLFHRFAFAYGLSIPPEEGPDVALQPPEPHPSSEKSVRADVVSYADTKDLV